MATSNAGYEGFHCWRCGACCMSLAGIEGYENLDDGTGTCIYFDRETRDCKIYEHRPLTCDVWGTYEEYFRNDLSREEYARINTESCRELRARWGLPEPEALLARKKSRSGRA